MLLKRHLFRVCDKWIRNNPNIIEKIQEDNYMRMRKCDFKKVLSYFDDMNVLLRAVWIHNRAFVSKLQQKISMNKNLLLGHSMWNGPNFKKLPTWPSCHGFFWNFAKSMYPSRNENPENSIVFLWTVPKLKPSKP